MACHRHSVRRQVPGQDRKEGLPWAGIGGILAGPENGAQHSGLFAKFMAEGPPASQGELADSLSKVSAASTSISPEPGKTFELVTS